MHDWTLECGCTTTLFPFKMGLEFNINTMERNPIKDGSRGMFENITHQVSLLSDLGVIGCARTEALSHSHFPIIPLSHYMGTMRSNTKYDII